MKLRLIKPGLVGVNGVLVATIVQKEMPKGDF